MSKVNDLVNWIKSDLAQEDNVKLSKIMSPYRAEKIRFLRKALEILRDEESKNKIS